MTRPHLLPSLLALLTGRSLSCRVCVLSCPNNWSGYCEYNSKYYCYVGG